MPASSETKARYAFVVGDFRRVHRDSLNNGSTEPSPGGWPTIFDGPDRTDGAER
jgi:hypothetical protein